MEAPLLIADVPWLLYRAYFSLPKSIKGSDGRPVNALLGTVNALLSATEACPPRAVVACFGAEQARYRVEAYPPYHAHREPMPKELAEQWTRAPALLESFGWTIANAEQLEADDAMGSFARAEAHAGGRALLLTADRDLYQAVSDQVAVLDLGKGGACLVLGPARRPLRRAARRARDRREDGGAVAAQLRHAGGAAGAGGAPERGYHRRRRERAAPASGGRAV
jgi:DNA polymerase-1